MVAGMNCGVFLLDIPRGTPSTPSTPRRTQYFSNVKHVYIGVLGDALLPAVPLTDVIGVPHGCGTIRGNLWVQKQHGGLSHDLTIQLNLHRCGGLSLRRFAQLRVRYLCILMNRCTTRGGGDR